MIDRLLKKGSSGPGRPKTTINKRAVKPKAAPKPKRQAKLTKAVKNQGERLRASVYFKDVCGGKLYNCTPQWILQPDGSYKLKKIKLCDDAWGGRCAKWVAA